MNRAYALGAVALTAAVLMFAMQNLHLAPVEFFIWEIDTPVALVALAAFLSGLVIGWLSGRFRKSRRAKKATETAATAPPATPALGPGDPAEPPTPSPTTETPTHVE